MVVRRECNGGLSDANEPGIPTAWIFCLAGDRSQSLKARTFVVRFEPSLGSGHNPTWESYVTMTCHSV